MLFGDLSSVILVSAEFIFILHASFSDFLLDAARSKEFYIDLSSIHTTFASSITNNVRPHIFY
jgi:hypothetical protein